MAKSKRLLILTESEIYGLYERPQFAVEQQRFFFALNGQEKDIINQLRSRKYRCMAIALLGYFKSKPVILEPNYKEMQADIQFIADTHYDSLKLSRFSVNRMQKARIYAKILSLTGYSSWNTEDHNSELLNYLAEQVRAWASPRHLFDAAIEYMSSQGISIPLKETIADDGDCGGMGDYASRRCGK